MQRRDALKLGAGIAAAVLAPRVFAQDYPSKPITMIVPFAPGGNLDTVARIIAPALSVQLGQQVIVENRAGAGGAIGAGAAARAAADGHTLVISTPNAIAVLPEMIKAPYSIASFQPVGLVSSTSLVIVVKGDDQRFRDAASFLAYAKANPGKLNAGYAGTGTTNHVGMMLMEAAAKAQLNAVAYKGSGPALTDLLGGQIDAVVDQLTSSISHVKSGKLRALAVLSRERDPLLPEAPTLREAGLDNFDVSTLTGILAPLNTPKAVIARLNTAIAKAFSDPALRDKLQRVGSVARLSTPEEFAQILGTENKQARELVAAGKLHAD